jgi:hypothetical protein
VKPPQPPAPQHLQTGNAGGVTNGPKVPTTFTFTEPVRLVWLQTYHWNHARGATPGRIGVRHEDGTVYGPWQSRGLPGQGGVPNAYWRAEAGVVLKPGTYTVTDSDPATWATNAKAGNKGFADLEVVPVAATPPAPVAPTVVATPAGAPVLSGRWASRCDQSTKVYPVTISQDGSRLRVVVEGQGEYQGTFDGKYLKGGSADGLFSFDGTVISPTELRLEWEGRASADGILHLNNCTFKRQGPPPAAAAPRGGAVPCKRGGRNPFEEDQCIEIEHSVPTAPR